MGLVPRTFGSHSLLESFCVSFRFLIHTRFTAACRLFPSSPFHLFGWWLNCCWLILCGSRFCWLVIAETFTCFSPFFYGVLPVFYTFLGIIPGLPFPMFQSTNAMFCSEYVSRVISVICFALKDSSCIIVVFLHT